MRKLRLPATACAAALLAGCAGPATRSDAVTAAPVMAPPLVVAVAPPATTPMPSSTLDRIRRLAPGLDPGVLALALEARACALRNGEVDDEAKLAVID